MWISRERYDSLTRELAEQRTKREAAETQGKLQQHTVEWLTVQVNTLQYERAALLQKVTGSPIMVPSIRSAESVPPVGDRPAPKEQFFNQMAALFEDVGDEAAVQLGITSEEPS